MIHITIQAERQQKIIRIDGRLDAEDVPLLDLKCSEIGGPHIVDISNMISADAAGAERLRHLVSSGVEIHGASPYLKLLIDSGD